MTMTFKVPMTHTTYTYNTSRLQSAKDFFVYLQFKNKKEKSRRFKEVYQRN